MWGLDKVAECLGPFVEKQFKAKGISLTSTTDPSVLLKAITQQSYVFEPNLSKLEKTWAHELLEYRHRISHGERVTAADACRALDTACRLCVSVGCDQICGEITDELEKIQSKPILPTRTQPDITIIKEPSMPTAPSNPELYYLKFWAEVLSRMKSSSLTSTKTETTKKSFVSIPAGKKGFKYYLAFTQIKTFRVEIYIDNDKEGEEWNKKRFNEFLEKKVEIERLMGAPLSWQRLEERRAYRIAIQRPVHDREAEREELIDWGIKMFVKLRNVFGPLIR